MRVKFKDVSRTCSNSKAMSTFRFNHDEKCQFSMSRNVRRQHEFVDFHALLYKFKDQSHSSFVRTLRVHGIVKWGGVSGS